MIGDNNMRHEYSCPKCHNNRIPYVINEQAHVCTECGWKGTIRQTIHIKRKVIR